MKVAWDEKERQAAVLIGIGPDRLGGLYLTGGIPFREEPFPAGSLGDVYVDSYRADCTSTALWLRVDYQVKSSKY